MWAWTPAVFSGWPSGAFCTSVQPSLQTTLLSTYQPEAGTSEVSEVAHTMLDTLRYHRTRRGGGSLELGSLKRSLGHRCLWFPMLPAEGSRGPQMACLAAGTLTQPGRAP